MTQFKKNLFDLSKIVVLALVLAAGLQYVSAATSWAPAAGAPPGNNTHAPVNVGATGQSKAGGLTVGTANPELGFNIAGGLFRVAGPRTGTPSAGMVLKAADNQGNVVWGTDLQGSGGGGGGGNVSCSISGSPITCQEGNIPVFRNQSINGSPSYISHSGITKNLANGDVNLANRTLVPELCLNGACRTTWPSAGATTLGHQNCTLTAMPSCSSTMSPRCPVGTYMAGAEMTRASCGGSDNNIKLQAYCCAP